MTKDLAICVYGSSTPEHYLNTVDFLDAVVQNLQKHLSHWLNIVTFSYLQLSGLYCCSTFSVE